jgi:Bifunctional DNA primase/polymerase, N-terminal/Primase C terminal 1 (PriCT-1)
VRPLFRLFSILATENSHEKRRRREEKMILAHILPKKINQDLTELADRLYNNIPPICWETERNMAEDLGVSRRQLRYAKALLELQERVRIIPSANGKRSNPVHTLFKVNPINHNIERDDSTWEIDWTLFNDVTTNQLNRMSVVEQLEFYREIGFQTIPLHFPKFKRGKVFCSCRRGRNCPSIGKHPVIPHKNLDFSDIQTYKAMQAYWKKEPNYNVGFKVEGFLVLDVDYKNYGQYSFAYIQDEIGNFPDDVSVITGNGQHIYARPCSAISNGVDVMGLRGLDVRSAGGIVAAPGSVHVSQNQYRWESVGEPEPLSEDWMLNLIGEQAEVINLAEYREKRDAAQPAVLLPKTFTPDYVIPKGQRNTTLFKFACRERGKGAEYPFIYDVLTTLNETYCEPPLDNSEIKRIAASASEYLTEAQKRGIAA